MPWLTPLNLRSFLSWVSMILFSFLETAMTSRGESPESWQTSSPSARMYLATFPRLLSTTNLVLRKGNF